MSSGNTQPNQDAIDAHDRRRASHGEARPAEPSAVAKPTPGGSPASRHHKPRHHPPPDSGFSLVEKIGTGSFAIVYKGEWGGDLLPAADARARIPRQEVAIKVVQRWPLRRDKRLMETFEAEMAILKQMVHPHIVHLIDVVKTSNDFNLIMEYCSYGDLWAFIRRRQTLIKRQPGVAEIFSRYPSPHEGLHPALVRHFLAQLACSLAFLRQHDIVHRDLKPQNLLLKPGAASPEEARELGYAGSWSLPVIKIADFGFARFLPATSMAETLCGSPLYMAPEILNYEKYNAKADLWSVGAVTYEMVTGKPPFPAANHLDLAKKIKAGNDVIKFPVDVAEDLQAVVRGLLKQSPNERTSFEDFFEHTAWSETSKLTAPKLAPDHTYPAGPAGPAAGGSAGGIAGGEIPGGGIAGGGISSGGALAAASAALATLASPSSSAELRSAAARSGSGAAGTVEGPQLLQPRSSPLRGGSGSLRGSDVGSPTQDSLGDAGATTGSTSKSGSSNDGYSAYLRRHTGNDVAVESATPSPESSTRGGHSPHGVDTTRLTSSSSRSPQQQAVGGTGQTRGGHDLKPRSDASDHEYVFIEKRAVEVNSLADDLQAPAAAVTQRRLTNPERLPRRRRLSSIAYGASPTSALAQALLKSSARLFGAKIGGGEPAVSATDAFQAPLSVALTPPKTGEKQIIDELEQLATISKVVILYAGVKSTQLDSDDEIALAAGVPSPRESHVGSGRSSSSMRSSAQSALYPMPSPSVHIDPYFQLALAQESLALHLKALGVLAHAMDRASEWWAQQQNRADLPSASPGINTLVQWIRDKFNECVGHAETERQLIQRLTVELAGDAHSSALKEISAERLLFDRALEMAKAAAVQEMAALSSVSHDEAAEAFTTCEMNYGTAVWMLKALFISDKPEEALSDDDRAMVDTLMSKIAQRLASLRRKSSAAVHPGGHSRWSPSVASGSPGSPSSLRSMRMAATNRPMGTQLTPP